jgi:hypothetical protein
VFPGGFHYIYNLGSVTPDRYPMSQLTDMITNFGGVVLGLTVLLVWGFKKQAGIAIMLFSAFEVAVHILLANKSLAEFGGVGQHIFYAPGLVTALTGFLPVAVGFAVYFVKHRPHPKLRHWLGGVATLIVLSFLLVNLPEMLLKNENSPYAWNDHGFYEQFINSEEVNKND